MVGEIYIPGDMCAGNTIPGETRIPMIPGLATGKNFFDVLRAVRVELVNTCPLKFHDALTQEEG